MEILKYGTEKSTYRHNQLDLFVLPPWNQVPYQTAGVGYGRDLDPNAGFPTPLCNLANPTNTNNCVFKQIGLNRATNLAAQWSAAQNNITITWTNNSPDANYYRVWRKIGELGVWTDLGADVGCASGSTCGHGQSVTAGDINPGTYYYYKVIPRMYSASPEVHNPGSSTPVLQYLDGEESNEAGACTCVAVANAAWTPATSAAIAYPPNFVAWSDLYGFTNVGGNTAGDTARFSFSGDSIAYWFAKAWWAGIADVKIDGQSRGSVNLYAPYDALWAVGKYYGGLGPGNHTIEITVNGATSGIDNHVSVFGFELGLVGLPPGLYGGPQSYRGFNWTVQPGGGGWTCSLADSADFRFDGTSLTYYHGKGPHYAVAAITIDGVSHGEIDLYDPIESWGQSDTFANLGPGPHILHIESVYTNPNAQNNCIDVSGLEVQ
jgi:hypothetical protein